MEDQRDEQTLEQSGASDASPEEGQLTQESSDPGQSMQTEEADLIPQKFVGKSAADILQAYKELEKDSGRLRNELGSARKEREVLEEQYRQSQRQAMQRDVTPMQAPIKSVQVEEDLDPESIFDAKFEEDPKEAIREALRAQKRLGERERAVQSLQSRANEANEYYWKMKKENSDYARREPLMQQLVGEFQDVIRPEHFNSTKVLRALDLMSKGADLDYYTKGAAESAKRDGLSTRDEKRRAQSESSNSGGDASVKFTKLSLKEMEDYLGKTDE